MYWTFFNIKGIINMSYQQLLLSAREQGELRRQERGLGKGNVYQETQKKIQICLLVKA